MLVTIGAAVFEGSLARRSTMRGSCWAADPTCRTSSVQAVAAKVPRRMTGSGSFESESVNTGRGSRKCVGLGFDSPRRLSD